MPQPQDKAVTRRLLGTITYLSKFCPHLNEVVHPIPDLTHLSNKLLWADQHTEAFMRVKELVSQGHVSAISTSEHLWYDRLMPLIMSAVQHYSNQIHSPVTLQTHHGSPLAITQAPFVQQNNVARYLKKKL